MFLSLSLKPISLRARIGLSLIPLITIALAGGLVTVLSVNQISSLVLVDMDRHTVALNVAQELKSSLSMQKGLLTYYFLDGDPSWMKELNEHHLGFEEWLLKARSSVTETAHRSVLNEIESRYIRYIYARNRVVQLYDAGERTEGLKLHKEIRSHFSEIIGLCEQYKNLQQQSIAEAQSTIRDRVRSIRILAALAMAVALFLGVALSYTLMSQVLGPLRRMATETGSHAPEEPVLDEVKALSHRVRSLMEDVDQTQTELQQSREHLIQAEKLASVGKLAAGVAHSIRNPLTSVKMRLFSLERTLELSPTQREDIEVISEEIRHIDTIVRNFLEFSRPPKLKLQSVSPSDVVDSAIQLLRHRIESYGIEVELYRSRRLPAIDGDPEQLKEVLVNLMVNACDAMADGGKITIQEEEGVSEPTGGVVVIRVSDTGPGVPEAIKETIFQPFFSTKEEGTGLGLSIAARIIQDHKGCLNLRSREGKGATFIITLPYRGDKAWLRY